MATLAIDTETLGDQAAPLGIAILPRASEIRSAGAGHPMQRVTVTGDIVRR